MLLNERLDINYLNTNDNACQSALHLAVMKGNVEIVKLLLSNENIDVNVFNHINETDYEDENTALYTAVKNGKLKIVNLLLSHKNIDVNILNNSTCGEDKTSETALHLAVRKRKINTIRLLLKHEKIDINVKDKINMKKPIEYTRSKRIIRLFKKYSQ